MRDSAGRAAPLRVIAVRRQRRRDRRPAHRVLHHRHGAGRRTSAPATFVIGDRHGSVARVGQVGGLQTPRVDGTGDRRCRRRLDSRRRSDTLDAPFGRRIRRRIDGGRTSSRQRVRVRGDTGVARDHRPLRVSCTCRRRDDPAHPVPSYRRQRRGTVRRLSIRRTRPAAASLTLTVVTAFLDRQLADRRSATDSAVVIASVLVPAAHSLSGSPLTFTVRIAGRPRRDVAARVRRSPDGRSTRIFDRARRGRR